MRRLIRAAAPLMLALAAFTLAPAAAAEETPPPVAVPGDLGWGSAPSGMPAAVQDDLGWG